MRARDGGPDGGGAVSFSRRAYGRLLALYPRRFRGLYGEEMADLFEEVCRERLARDGAGGLLRAWIGALPDLAAGSAAERSRSVAGYSAVRWGGLSAAVGGLISVACGLVLPWLLAGPGGWTAAMVGAQLVGLLLLAGGLFGVAALLAGRARPEVECLGRPQGFARAGFSASIVATTATVGLLAVHLLCGVLGAGGPDAGTAGAPRDALYLAFGLTSIFGIPAATILLGAAAWRSGLLGRWRPLPAAVGALSLLAPVVGTAAAHAVWGFAPDAETLGAFVILGIPQVAIGVGWTFLGAVLAKHEDGARRTPRFAAGTRG